MIGASGGASTGAATRVWPRAISAAAVFVAALGLTLVAYVLRVWTLGAAAFWYDEVYSVNAALKPLPGLFATIVPWDNNPPGHYLALHVLLPLFGASEFTARYVSLIPGALLVPLAFATARQVFAGSRVASSAGPVAGLVAATIVGLSPYLIFYAQEARMYSQLALFALVAVLSLLRATRPGADRKLGQWRWTIHGLALALAVYAHYGGLLLVPALGLFAALNGRAVLRRWLGALALAVALWLPWLGAWLSQVRRFGATPEYFLAELNPLWTASQTLADFLAAPSAGMGGVVGGLILLGLALLAAMQWRGDEALARRVTLIGLAAGAPVLAIALAAIAVPKFATRYALVGQPALLIGLAVLIGWLWSRGTALRLASLALVVVAVGWLTPRAWSAAHAPWLGKDDPRAVAEYLNERVQADQAIVHVRALPDAFDYYYRGPAPLAALDVFVDYDSAAARLTAVLASEPQRVWLVRWQDEFTDPSGFVIAELTRRAERPPTVRSNYIGYQLMRFDLTDWSPVVGQPEPQTPLAANFGDRLTLVGADRLNDGPGLLRYILYWQARQRLGHDYSVAFQLVDGQGQVRFTHNQPPSAPWFATASFPPGVTLRGLTNVRLPVDLAPGVYTAQVLVWDPVAQRNLTRLAPDGAEQGAAALLGTVEITPSLLRR